MKPLFVLLLTFSFWAMAGFGFASMNHLPGHGACIASLVQGSLCPGESNVLAFVNLHAGAFRTFSSAVFESAFAMGLMAVSFLLILSLRFLKSKADPPQIALPLFKQDISKIPLSARARFVDWWALHEKRDPTISLTLLL